MAVAVARVKGHIYEALLWLLVAMVLISVMVSCATDRYAKRLWRWFDNVCDHMSWGIALFRALWCLPAVFQSLYGTELPRRWPCLHYRLDPNVVRELRFARFNTYNYDVSGIWLGSRARKRFRPCFSRELRLLRPGNRASTRNHSSGAPLWIPPCLARPYPATITRGPPR